MSDELVRATQVYTYWECPKHGVLPVVGMAAQYYVVGPPDAPQVPEEYRHRNYCWVCWVQMMDRFCEQVTKVVPSSDA